MKHIIKVEKTNNPEIVKFCSNQLLVKGGSYQFNSLSEAVNSNLAQQILQLPFADKVFISTNFIALQKLPIVEWSAIENELSTLIEAYLNQGNQAVDADATPKKVVLEIYAETTPNPETIKFGTNKLIAQNSYEFTESEQAHFSPLALALFNFPFVKGVYLDDNYISITKNESVSWSPEIVNQMRSFIKDYIESNQLIIDETKVDNTKGSTAITSQVDINTLEGTSRKIAEILEEYVKPAVANDGGNIVFESYDEDTQNVNVILQGACSGCPSSTVTLKNGIETMLKEMLPNKINTVIAVNG